MHSKNILINNGKPLIADFGISNTMATYADFGISNTMATYADFGISNTMAAYFKPQFFIAKEKKLLRVELTPLSGFIYLDRGINSRMYFWFRGPTFLINICIFLWCARNYLLSNREELIPGTPQEYADIYKKCWSSEPKICPQLNDILFSLDRLSTEISVEFIINSIKSN
ncbi:kinase-like protein [Gigaspora margarita]|uniref:Kinase-like protein n=1 Tax=Gigaspora margarita TaxID=4874 RepID=A0A8H4A0C4_GIGMA|nr:kinase-like protein [Gigaspora margarita]